MLRSPRRFNALLRSLAAVQPFLPYSVALVCSRSPVENSPSNFPVWPSIFPVRCKSLASQFLSVLPLADVIRQTDLGTGPLPPAVTARLAILEDPDEGRAKMERNF